ncbi:MAG TPA: sulfotransferase [Xanthomonadaceae bacterium]|nr:sulfotransferase [Xanthomonadaceae bacterium]
MSGSDAMTGMQLARMGRFAEALPFLDRANRAAPIDVPVLHAAGNLLVLAGRGAEADERYRLAASLLPKDLNLLCGWARVSLMMGLREQALDLFDRALAIERRYANPGGWLESILREVADADTACHVLQALVDRHPQHAGLRGVHAKMLLANERLQDAQCAFEAYHAMCPHDVWVRVELGGLAAGRGDPDTARAYFRAALKSDPGNPDALWGLVELNGWRLDDALLKTVRNAIAAKPATRVLARLHETLARHHDRAGEFPAAWRHAARTNALMIEATPPPQRYDLAQHESRIDTLVRDYTTLLFERLRGAGSKDRRPVFVIGLPRSGTTLLERMLAAHPRMVGVGEQRFAEAGWKRALAASGQSHDTLPAQAIDEAAAWHLRMLEQRVRHLGLPAGADRIVDKMPDNYLMAGWLCMAFPGATIVHIRRDPRDVALSCWFAQFTGEVAWINELRHIAHRIEQHRRLMRHWRATIGERLIEIRYEDLVAEPETEARRILAASGMDWHPDVAAFAERRGYVGSASRQQVREPIHGRSLARWRNYEVALQPILDRLHAIAAQDAIDADDLHCAEQDVVPAG